MKRNIVTVLILLVLALVLVYFLGDKLTPWESSGRTPTNLMMSEMGHGVDQHFIIQMIPHHEGAIAMAEVALERSKRDEILSLARGIIEAQEMENREMRAWYAEWFGSVPPTGGFGMMHMGGMEGDLEALKAVSESEFDREFIVQMIPHHEMAIVMAEMLRSTTKRSEMKQLADNIIISQAREIEMMRSWLKAWY